MNQTNDQMQTSNQNNLQARITPNTQQTSPILVGLGKEQEAKPVIVSETVQPIPAEIELPKEVAGAGVIPIEDTIEIPPDVQKLGVGHAGSTAPIASSTVLPRVTLPISDQQVVAGLHAQITSAFLWLAVWCIKKLKKAHLVLKEIHGKIVRVKI